MSDTVIRVENLSKKYIISHVNHGRVNTETFREVVTEKTKKLFGFSSKKETANTTEEFLALNDVSFDIKQGERVGIIGRNGAGKSTLLKILSRITEPTIGKIEIIGRVSSLLEVGTGFHAELTGRENIFLNGAVLGMSRREIAKKYDEIVDFSGVEKFLDTPVKRYSSGMYVRLAFAVAAHLEPEILIVDEVLAVGDAEFQKKCMGKMKDVSTKEGRTILFVSHNMTAVQSLCKKGILLNNGKIDWSGNAESVVNKYMSLNSRPLAPIRERKDRIGDGRLRFTDIESLPTKDVIKTGSDVFFRIYFTVQSETPLKNVAFSFSINTLAGNHALVFSTEETNSNIESISNNNYIDCLIENFPITAGSYFVNLFSTVNGVISDYIINAKVINVDDSEYFSGGASKDPQHPIYVTKHRWLT